MKTINGEPPNIARQIWPFCAGCGQHAKSAAFRYRLNTVRCDDCVARPRWYRRAA